MRSFGESYLTGVDDVVAQRLIMDSPEARKALAINEAVTAKHIADTGLARSLGMPVSIYTALAAAGETRLLGMVDENPPMGMAVRKFVTAMFHYSFRRGSRITDCGVRSARYLSDEAAFAAQFYRGPATGLSRDNHATKPDDEYLAFVHHNERLSRAAVAPGMVDATKRLLDALERYATQKGYSLDTVSVIGSRAVRTADDCEDWRGHFGHLRGKDGA